MQPRAQQGFTLIEVTLAIVIGVVVVAGATVLYQQAKLAVGNTRAQTRVSLLQSIAETYAARNFGNYPTRDQIRQIWSSERPDDYDVSPWGGPVGTAADGSDYGIYGSVTSGVVSGAIPGTWGDQAAFDAPTTAGGMQYIRTSSRSARTIEDLMLGGATVSVRNYVIWISDQSGKGPNFVLGGK